MLLLILKKLSVLALVDHTTTVTRLTHPTVNPFIS